MKQNLISMLLISLNKYNIFITMQESFIQEKRQEEMLNVCIPQKIAEKKKKDLERTCRMLFQKQCNLKKQTHSLSQNCLLVGVCSSSNAKNQETNEKFILGCLLYLFIKFKSLKVKFNAKNANFKAKDSQSQIYLTVKSESSINFSQQFFSKLFQALWSEQNYLSNKRNHFMELVFLCDQNKSPKNLTKIRQDVYLFVSSFYQNLSLFFNDKPPYIYRNYFSGFQKAANALKYIGSVVSSMRNVHSRYLTIHGLSSQSVIFLSKEEDYKRQFSADIQEDSALQELGMFKEFDGTPLQYLQALDISLNNVQSDIDHLMNILKLTPNLKILRCLHHEQILVDNVDKLLQMVIASTPSLQKIVLKNIRVQNIKTQILWQIYNGCPFLIELQIGLRYNFSIAETYEHKSPEQKDLKQKEREQQLIMEALRLRNITLNNNLDMAKLLLKKQYNFLQTIQIINCIEPICF